MRFVDASVFVHAFIKPRRELKEHEIRIKEAAKEIVKRINEGEKVAISTVHLSEIANLLEHYMPIDDALSVETFLLTARNVMYTMLRKMIVSVLWWWQKKQKLG